MLNFIIVYSFFSLIYLILILKVVMPYFRPVGATGPHVAASFFTDFGKTPLDVVCNIFSHPVKFISHVFHPYKSINYIMYLLPFSFVPLFGAKVLVIGIFSLFFLAMSSAVSHSSYFLYYISPIFVCVVWATVMGIPKLTDFSNNCRYLRRFISKESEITKERIVFAILCGSIMFCLFWTFTCVNTVLDQGFFSCAL